MQVPRPAGYETKPLWAIQALMLVSLTLATAGLIDRLLQWSLQIDRHPLIDLALLESLATSFFTWFITSLIVLVCFAGVPGLLLFFLNCRSWRATALVGCLIAFCAGAVITTMGGLASGPHAAAWLGDKPTMIDGRLTGYGRSVYGLWAALKTGALTSPVGASLALVLWRIAYRRAPAPSAPTLRPDGAKLGRPEV